MEVADEGWWIADGNLDVGLEFDSRAVERGFAFQKNAAHGVKSANERIHSKGAHIHRARDASAVAAGAGTFRSTFELRALASYFFRRSGGRMSGVDST